jgi:hypothetical protein
MGSPPSSWQLALQLEAALRESAKKQAGGGFWSSNTRALRAGLQQAYEACLFEDLSFALVRKSALKLHLSCTGGGPDLGLYAG